MENLAIVVHTCDHYNFCWKPFFFYLCKFFELDKYNGKIYFINEETDINFEEYIDLKYKHKFVQIKTGKCLDELKFTSLYLDRLTVVLSTELNELPQLRTPSVNTL